jgi:phosphosulfolactate synthase
MDGATDRSARPGDLRQEPVSTKDFVRSLGVADMTPRTCPFDPGYDPITVEAHLAQSAHLMSLLKISMACWMVADEVASRHKVEAARRAAVPTVTGGGPFEIAQEQGALEAYLDLCGDMGFQRIEAGEGFTTLHVSPNDVVRMSRERSLDVQFELGEKHAGSFDAGTVDTLIEQGRRWLDAGAVQLVVEARESAQGIGLFDHAGRLEEALADRLADAFGFEKLVFEAPNKSSQFALLDHFGAQVQLCNVRLEELLRVEIYRRGLHSDAFSKPNLRPANRRSAAAAL